MEFQIPSGQTYADVDLNLQFNNNYGFPAQLTVTDADGVIASDSGSGSWVRAVAAVGSATLAANGSRQTIRLSATAVQRMNDTAASGGGILFLGLTGPSSGTYSVEFTSASLAPDVGPTVTSISPNFGSNNGGTSVTLTGTNLANVHGVSFGGNPANHFTVNSATQITAESPPGSGVINVRVASPDGVSATGTGNQFTYHSPTITSATVSGTTASVSGTFTPGQSPGISLRASGDPFTDLDFRNVTANGSGVWSTSFDMSSRPSGSYTVSLYDYDLDAYVASRSFTYTARAPRRR
jgi:hypothetical protein